MTQEITVELDHFKFTVEVTNLVNDLPDPTCRDSADTARIENQLAIDLGIPARPASEFKLPDPDPKCWLCDGSGVVVDEPCDICMKVTA